MHLIELIRDTYVQVVSYVTYQTTCKNLVVRDSHFALNYFVTETRNTRSVVLMLGCLGKSITGANIRHISNQPQCDIANMAAQRCD